jgi:FHA domain
MIDQVADTVRFGVERPVEPVGVLVVTAPQAIQGHQVPLHGPDQLLGRTVHPALDRDTISRRHARIWLTAGQLCIEDLGSANGTTVNGVRLTGPRTLRAGDLIRLGEVETQLRLAPAHQGWAAPDPSLSDSTRYLCAATHIDRHYRENVLDLTIRERHRAVSPSYGVDLALVARHALLAHRRALLRDAVLTVLLPGVVVLTALIAVDLASGQLRHVPTAAALIALAVIVVAAETWARLSTLGRYLRPGGRPDLSPSRTSATARRQLAELAEGNSGNVVVYSIYEPFVGSGIEVDRTSYPVPLLPRGDGEDHPARVVDFGSRELIDEITAALYSLRLENMQIDRRLFVDGYDVARFRELLPDPGRRPAAFAPPWFLDQLTEHPTGSVRPYLSVRTTGWRGQLVVTTFVRVVVLKGLLFVESPSYVLPPLRGEYLSVDSMRIRTTGERIARTVAETARRVVPTLVASPARLAAAAGARRRARALEREFRRRLADRVVIDRGTVASVREQAAGTEYARYFMQLDAEMAVSVVQQRIADTLKNFLAARGYQTDKITLIQNRVDNSVRLNNVHGNLAGVGNNARGNVQDRRTTTQGAAT